MKWTTAKRDAYYKEHPENFAGPEKTYPIEDASDVEDAARLHGQAQDKSAIKKKIIQIARRLKLTSGLPDEWKADLNIKESGHISLEAHIIEGQSLTNQADAPGHEVRVTVIQGGKSKNGYSYDTTALQSIANMLEGAHAYADHARSLVDESTRSVRDVIGFYHDAQLVPYASDGNGGAGRVDATLHVFEAADWLWSLIQEANALGRPELIGLSIDILGQWQHNQDTRAKDVHSIAALNSCDVVTRPSAGGAFRRILHSEQAETEGDDQDKATEGDDQDETNTLPQEGDSADMEKKLDKLPAVPNSASQETQAQTSQEQSQQTQASIQESQQAQATATQQQEQLVDQAQATQIQENQRQQAQAQAQQEQARISEQTQQTQQMQVLMQELKLERAQGYLERSLGASILPEPVKQQVRSRFSGRIFESQELEGEISSQVDMLAALTSAGLIRGNGYEKPSAVTSMITESEKIQAAFDRMFDLDIDTARMGNVRGFGSILEAYRRVTGDSNVQGGISGNSLLGQIRVSESSPITRISEADTTTASFSYLLGTSMNKRLLKDYQAWPAEWMKFTTVAPIRDFKQQVRVRFGAFGSLPIVPEDTAYAAVSLIDSAATYVPQKRGNLVTVSREVIINDDLMAVKQIPTKLAVAAAYTLAEFVYAFLSANPNIYDGAALFTSGANSHLNLGSAALSTAAMQLGVTAMREQTNYAGKRIGLRPRYLVVPPELEWTAMVATKSAGVPGSTNNDINPMLGYVTPIVSAQLSSATQWFLAADPREIDTIELGFVGGQMNPQLFIQDSPLLGLNFTQDVISYKCRHEYGGCVVDYRGLYRGL